METKTMTVGELTAQMVVEAKRLGFSEATIWRGWMPGAGMVAKYYREQGLCVYDPAVTDKFLQKLEDRYASGEVSYNYNSEFPKSGLYLLHPGKLRQQHNRL